MVASILGLTFGARTNDHAFIDAIHDIRIARFADTHNMAILDSDIGLSGIVGLAEERSDER